MSLNETPGPRLPPLPQDQWDDRALALIAQIPGTLGPRVPNVVATLLHHPELLTAYTPFATFLLIGGRLARRDRELLILRTAILTGARYEWSRHVPLAQQAGLTQAEIHRVVHGPDDPAWPDAERDLLAAADELHNHSRLSDAAWQALTARYDYADLIEIMMLVGHYHMAAYVLNSAATELDPGFQAPCEFDQISTT